MFEQSGISRNWLVTIAFTQLEKPDFGPSLPGFFNAKHVDLFVQYFWLPSTYLKWQGQVQDSDEWPFCEADDKRIA